MFRLLSLVVLVVAVDAFQLPKQKSGYICVNATSNAFMFYWFFPAANNDPQAPVVLWLQGGPGSSGIQDGLFLEHGPYMLDDDGNLANRSLTWASNFSMIYVDNPVGTGFSYVDDGGYVTNEDQVAAHLGAFLKGFFDIYDDWKDNDFYVMGESFGGHYVPAIANYILLANGRAQLLGADPFISSFAGIAIGDGLTDPITQEQLKPTAAYNFGLVDIDDVAILQNYANLTAQSIQQGDFATALAQRTLMEDYIKNVSDINLMDVRTFDSYSPLEDKVTQFLNLPSTLQALNVGSHTFNDNSSKVADALANDKMTSLAHLFPFIISKIKVLFYQGQFDLKDGAVSNQAWISQIQWSGQANYLAADRHSWSYVDSQGKHHKAGWVKAYGRLTEVVVSDAGHMSPMDNPAAVLDMVTKFVFDLPFH